MISVTVQYGLTKSLTTEVPEGTTIRGLLTSPATKAALGYPENVSAVVDGITVGYDEELSSGDVVVLEKQAASKA